MARPRGQYIKGRARSQPVDPITGRRMNLTGATIAELESRSRRLQDVRDGLKFGDITIREAQGRLRPTVGLNLRLADLWTRYMRGVPASSERIGSSLWRRMVAPALGELTVWELTETKMREWKTDLERVRRSGGGRGYAPKTIRLVYDFLRGALALAIRDGALSEYPWGAFSVPNPPRPQRERESLRDPAELVALLTAARAFDLERGHELAGRFPVIVFLGLTGLRQAEAAGLAWSDVDLERDPPTLRVRVQAGKNWPRFDGGRVPSKPPKGKRTRDQILHPNVASVLRLWRKELQAARRYSEAGPVFPRPGGGEYRTSGRVIACEAFRACVTRAGLPNPAAWVVHSLRHSFARLELVGHGGDLRSVAARTGHSDLTVLEGYLRKPSRLAGGSRIPELPPALSPVLALEAPAVVGLELSRAAGLEDAAPAAPVEDPGKWPELARAWIAGGRRLIRPAAVTAQIEATYGRAYARERQRGATKEAAREAGRRARRGALGAWGKILAAVERGEIPPALLA